MSLTRTERAKLRLENYYEAEQAILSAQDYTINGRKLTRADLGEVRKVITELENLVAKLEGGGNRTFRIVIRDI